MNAIEKMLKIEQEELDDMEIEPAPSGEWEEYNYRFMIQDAVVAALGDAVTALGRCEWCFHSKQTKSDALLECELGYGVHKPEWYCADYEEREDD